ncbi:glycerol-3-phosphate dehydrogenase [Bacillus sp. FJAT-25509]|uniref:glycerol-3-phosphate dehydrogenase/oxidase n=1 Tax=Bacillus sp. FJAT-25509 TaxID=1712029 RepID=UPI0006FF631C|nr:glycerol-3-phosphate dehydrogenase/oxidase [Bacillus sp. FJAT-25509]KQL38968.1 glycerol-3-phosphate dehydrogenase [Bacillus sp. FJAT-25509]
MEEQFSSLNRKKIKKALAEKEFDLLVIGGGITGCGIALDATTRGMSTALVEMQDFASGTSSRSTKLVHGGLRYLKQYEFKMVAEVGKERAIVYENGPHVTTPEWMLLPIYKGGTFGKFTTSLGLRLYDYLAGVKKDERRKILNRKETIEKEPLVKKEGLKAGGYYVEYRTDDARLTIEVIKKAVEYGAQAINYVEVTDFIYENNRIVGAKAIDLITKVPFTIRAKRIVNATGPWVDQLREMERLKSDKNLRLTKGVHLVIDHKKFPLNQSVYFDTIDGRMVFAIPRDGKTYVGTTDTFFDRDTSNPKVSNEDREYILNCVKYMFPTIKLEDTDVESSWAGIRPLIFEEGKDPSEISRKDEIWESSSGLISIAGGKLTGYRKMAETIVDLILKDNDNRFRECLTKNLPISGGDVGGSKGFNYFKKRFSSAGIAIGLSESEYKRLSRVYGSNIEHLMNISFSDLKNDTNLPLSLFLQLEYGIQNEMIVKPVDFFIRRTGFLYFHIDLVNEYKDEVIRYMANRLSWSKYQIVEYSLELEEQIKNAITASNE